MFQSDKNFQRRIKKQLKSKQHTFFAVVKPGFEKIAEKEISEITNINIQKIEIGGILFTAKLEQMWKIHLQSFIISSIRLRITTFRAGTIGEAISKTKEIPWELYLPKTEKLIITSKLKQCRIKDSSLLCRITEREISSKLHCFYGESFESTSQSIQIRGEKNQYTLSLDCSGSRFYSRGYRKAISDAPIRETTAAAIIHAAQFSRYKTFVDPMCGSGTFTLEAIAHNQKMLPGFSRYFPFMDWPSFRKKTWNYLLQTEIRKSIAVQKNKKRKGPDQFIVGDIASKALDNFRLNLEELKKKLKQQDLFAINKTGYEKATDFKLNEKIKIIQSDFFKQIEPIISNSKTTFIVINPPYGKRIKSNLTFYKKLSKILNTQFSKSAVAIIVPNIEAEKALNLKTDHKILFFNGGIKCALLIRESSS